MRAIEICAGAGGLGYGLSLAGFDVVGVERDADAVATHNAHAGPCVCADVTEWHAPHSAELVAGGIPCQPFSVAGSKGGFADERGQLWLHLLRIADEASARAVLIENVRGLTTTRGPDGTTAMRYLLTQMASRGWRVAHQILDAADYGVPQHRDRVFIVGFREVSVARRFRWPEPTHGPRDNLLGLPRYVSVRDALGLSGEYQSGRDEGAAGWQGHRHLDVDEPSTTVSAFSRADKLSASGLLNRPATTVSASAGAVRLNAEQLALLQGFPPDWTFAGSKASQHRQIGNAVPPPLARAVGESLARALRGEP